MKFERGETFLKCEIVPSVPVLHVPVGIWTQEEVRGSEQSVVTIRPIGHQGIRSHRSESARWLDRLLEVPVYPISGFQYKLRTVIIYSTWLGHWSTGTGHKSIKCRHM